MIYILWPTIRTQMFLESHKKWMERCSNPSEIKTIVCVNNEEDFSKISNAIPLSNNLDIKIFKTDKIGVCGPAYFLSSNLKCEDNDIIVLASDDFVPPFKWQDYLHIKLDHRSGVLFCRDGYQAPDSSNMIHAAITIPIMTGKALKQLNNVIYHPIFTHMFSDCDLYQNAKDLGILIDERMSDPMVFEHCHWAARKRQPDENDQKYNNEWKRDEDIWNVRKKLPVSERIKI
jgi:hypothetical protein